MADFFPPNLEDGELWLPSEIIQEITSTNVISKNNIIHYPSIPLLLESKSSAAKSLPYVAPKTGNRFFTEPNGNGAIGVRFRVSYVDRSPCATLFDGSEVVPRPILYNPITQTQNQGFKKRGVEKSKGTGVFIPHTASYFKEPKEIEGPGVFFNHQLISSQRKKKSGMNGQEKYTNKKETLGEEDKQICLPNDWAY